MDPVNQIRGGKIIAANNLYTIILALALGAVATTAAFVAYTCYFQYGTIFKIQ